MPRRCLILCLLCLAATTQPAAPTTQPAIRITLYNPDPQHPWNRLHRAMFVRSAPDGTEYTHIIEPIIYEGTREHLQTSPSYERALSVLDEFISGHGEKLAINPLQRVILQHDLWRAFDSLAWVPNEWTHFQAQEPNAKAIRDRLATVMRRLSLTKEQIDQLPDTYAAAVAAHQFPSQYNPDHPEGGGFLPEDLFKSDGTWLRLGQGIEDIASRHYAGGGGRSAFLVFMRLPAGRQATLDYLKSIDGRDVDAATPQFPPGAQVALVRRLLALNREGKINPTPITDLVQLRVYRDIPNGKDRAAREKAQDVYEVIMDREKFFAGKLALRPVARDEVDPMDPVYRGFEPCERVSNATPFKPPADFRMSTCKACHSAPGIQSVLSLGNQRRARNGYNKIWTYTLTLDIELNSAVGRKYRQYNWGLLQGLLEDAER